VAVAITVLSAGVSALTACSVAALGTNGIFKGKGGAFQLLTRSLGPALGASARFLHALVFAKGYKANQAW
jgi:hypothetical protein